MTSQCDVTAWFGDSVLRSFSKLSLLIILDIFNTLNYSTDRGIMERNYSFIVVINIKTFEAI